MIYPKQKPVLEHLNSYYIHIPKLLKYCQQEFGFGCIHFKSLAVEGVIYFERDKILNGILQNKEKEVRGEGVVDSILEAADKDRLHINIYKIDPEKILFWASLPKAEKMYENLSTEFTDLEGLFKKMETEKITGYIDISLNEGKESGIIFFDRGRMIGSSYSWDEGGMNSSGKNKELLIKKIKELDGVFNVSKIASSEKREEHRAKEATRPLSSNMIPMLEELLTVFEKSVTTNKKIKVRFDTLLKNKFIEKTDKYLFLNPFSGEFEYTNQKILFNGEATQEELIHGVIESVKELAEELGMLSSLTLKLDPWVQNYKKELTTFGISF